VLFELSVIFLAAVFFLLIQKLDKDAKRKFLFTFLGILVFEYFTQALWRNTDLEAWAYLYLDVSWVIALGWTVIIVASRTIIDLYFPRETEGGRFLSYLLPITIIGMVAEGVVLSLGIRVYPAAVQELFSGIYIGVIPIETAYYIPVFMMLVIAFSRYWELATATPAGPATPKTPPATIVPAPPAKPRATPSPVPKQAKSKKVRR
jgi:hypothetical protein